MTVANRNENIITKIKGLLALANDNMNDEESQSAFMMAQKLMIKYDISSTDVDEQNDKKSVLEGQATVYKTLYWWERELAQIISKNFRVSFFYYSKKIGATKKRSINFLGFDSDIALAKEMYILAYDVLTFHSKKFVDDHYDDVGGDRSRGYTFDLKNSYMRGFLHSMSEKFEEQVKEMQQEYGLILLLPQEVKSEYDKRFGEKKGLSYRVPPIEQIYAYQQGLTDGDKVDYTKSTIDEGE